MANFVWPSVIVLIIWFLVNIHANQVPDPPTGVNVTSNGSRSILVEWNAVSNVFVYHVYYQKNGAGEWITEHVPENQTSLLINELMPYTRYLVKIKANTTHGVTNFSVEVQTWTDEAPPSAFPQITEIRVLDCCSIYLEWNPISDEKQNGILLGYRVYYLKKADVNDYKNKHKTVLLNITLTKTNITSLDPFTEYLVGVAAFNSKGVDESLATVINVKKVTTLEGAPSAPSGLEAKFITSSELVIQWVLIPDDKANGVLLGYRYVVYNNQTQILKNGTVSNTTNRMLIPNMEQCAEYTVHVRAWTAAGTGMDAVFNITNICAPPKIIKHESRVIVFPHKPAVLHCRYTGFPTPSVEWMINTRKNTVQPPLSLKEVVNGHERFTTPHANGSLTFSDISYSDAGLYTCFLNNSLGSATADTTMVVKESIHFIFLVNLTDEHFHNDLRKKQSSKFKRLSSVIKDEVLRLYNSTTKANIKDVEIEGFSEGSVLAIFKVTAITFPGAKPEDAKNEILYTMTTGAKNGKLGRIPIGLFIILGAPPPPDVQLVSKQPTYAVLRWVRPPFYKQYQINSYSVKYRKHGEDDGAYKTVESVADKDGTMKGVVTGLDPGQSYIVRVESHRSSIGLDYKKDPRYTTVEVQTPDIIMKQVMLTIILPVGLAIVITIIILGFIRPYFKDSERREDQRPNNTQLQNSERYGPCEENKYDIGRLLEEFPCRWKEIPRKDVTIGKELGAGAFGSVVRAEMKKDGKNIPCAAKMLKRFATKREHRDLFNELSIMSQVGNHDNIVSLIGACTINGPLWVIVKLAEGGCLLDFLHKHRKPEYTDDAYMNVQPSTSTDNIEKLDKLQKLKFAHGIARGMKHLEKMKCVHRDLAARNVLLSKSLVPMVSDFGLSRDIYIDGMYEDTNGGKRPVRWMAPESIEDYTCTPKSDVWSYGVTVWEIETAGTVPYAGVDSGMDILNEIKKGYRLEQPNDCDDDVYALMLDTWRANPLDRPSFLEIEKRVEEMLSRISEYLEIQNDEDDDDAMRAYYEVHISEEALANGYVAPADDPGHEPTNEHVRYTDIHGTALSEANNPLSPTVDFSRNASRDQDDEQEEDTSVQTKC